MNHSNVSPIDIVIPLVLAVILVAAGMTYMKRKGYYGIGGGRVIVRCREGHLFTTIWIPFGSFKAVRLGPLRYQYCPVGHHWTLVRLVNESELTDAERRFASQHHDHLIP